MASEAVRPAETAAAGRLAGEDDRLVRALAIAASVPDPEIPVVTIGELGMVRGGERTADGTIIVRISPTYTGCPATNAIRLAVELAMVEAGIAAARVETVLAPAWSSDDITAEGRRKLRAYGIAPPATTAELSALGGRMTAAECPRCGSRDTEEIAAFGSTPCKALWRCRVCREPFDVFKCL